MLHRPSNTRGNTRTSYTSTYRWNTTSGLQGIAQAVDHWRVAVRVVNAGVKKLAAGARGIAGASEVLRGGLEHLSTRVAGPIDDWTLVAGRLAGAMSLSLGMDEGNSVVIQKLVTARGRNVARKKVTIVDSRPGRLVVAMDVGVKELAYGCSWAIDGGSGMRLSPILDERTRSAKPLTVSQRA